jgi:hypothetical protein
MTRDEKLKYPWDIKWTARTIEVAKFIPDYASVVDLGGGLGEIYEYLKVPRYLSIDIERWNDHTIKANFNKGEFPDLGIKRQFVLCLGTLEYIIKPEEFLCKANQYANKMILTYRISSNGGMERKNNFDFETLRKLIENSGWEIITEKRITGGDRLFFCSKK